MPLFINLPVPHKSLLQANHAGELRRGQAGILIVTYHRVFQNVDFANSSNRNINRSASDKSFQQVFYHTLSKEITVDMWLLTSYVVYSRVPTYLFSAIC